MKCCICDEPIPPERLEILPDTQFCVNCSVVTALWLEPDKVSTDIDPDEVRYK